MMYPARGDLEWGHMRGFYLKSGGLHPLGGLYNILCSTLMKQRLLGGCIAVFQPCRTCYNCSSCTLCDVFVFLANKWRWRWWNARTLTPTTGRWAGETM